MYLKTFIGAAALSVALVGAGWAQSDCVQIASQCVAPDEANIVLAGDDIRDLARVRELMSLNVLELEGDGYSGPAVDLSVVNDLPNLEILAVTNVPVQDWGVVRNTNIYWLNYYGDVSLSELHIDLRKSLKRLFIDSPRADALTGGEAMQSLEFLRIWDIGAPDLTGLGFLPKLEKLYLGKGNLVSTKGWEAGPALREVHMENSNISDLSGLETATGLEQLRGKGSMIDDISPLAASTRMKNLFLTNTQVSDLDAIQGMTQLELLSLSNIPATDLSPLASLTGLSGLWLNKTNATDFTPLLGMVGSVIARIGSDDIIAGPNLLRFIETGERRD